MNEALGAAKSERTEGRLGFRSGHYARKLITRAAGPWISGKGRGKKASPWP
jgi:hypothetical protein